MNKFWIPFLTLLSIIGFFFWVSYREYRTDGEVSEVSQEERVEEQQVEEKLAIEADSIPAQQESISEAKESALERNPLDVTFVVQAPEATWEDERFQNACEEASLLMVGSFLRDKKIVNPRQEMLAIMDFEDKKFGHSYDTSAVDTNTILQEYFSITTSRVENVQSVKEIQEFLDKGELLVIPTDGRMLKNPYFTAPGPETHMLVVLGYDAKTKEFIVHDPGTKRGALYRYSERVLFDAIADYASGTKHKERKSIEKKVIAVPFE
ncbi:MAG: C39 family peptidase [Candidatus Moranbacteria bacterium]|nr:C39 family peptidase [Candidatus Moranbacteria bacterium]